MFHLPVTGIPVDVGPFTGAEDMVLLESGGCSAEISIALADRLARRSDGTSVDASQLPVADLEALILHLRSILLGDQVLTHGKCAAVNCGTQTDISFRISEYLAHCRPRKLPNVQPVTKEPGWYVLQGVELKFRLVTAADVLATQNLPDPETELARRTIRPEHASRRDVRRVQKAMEGLAPSLAQELEGSCPACGTTSRFFFNPQTFVQQELRYEAAFLYQDVHLLAKKYHWSEEMILSLPRPRRLHYAELAMQEGVAN
jgi:hypothetical protein